MHGQFLLLPSLLGALEALTSYLDDDIQCSSSIHILRYLLSFLEYEIHDKTDNGKADPNAGEDRVDNKESTADVDKLLILGNSN